MFQLTNAWSAIGFAALFGAIGGFLAELLIPRGKAGIGSVELPGPSRKGRLFDLGLLANVILGAGAAVAALWVLPRREVTITAAGLTTTVESYDGLWLIGISIVFGLASGAVLTSLQGRALAVINVQTAQEATVAAETKLQAAKGQADTYLQSLESRGGTVFAEDIGAMRKAINNL